MLPFRSQRARNAVVPWLFALVFCPVVIAADPSATPEKKERDRTSLTNIPLPIGQEAKGLVLPDFDTGGHLRARFEAGVAKRVDLEHMELRDLRMVTFTPQDTRELLIEMPASVVNLRTREIISSARSTVSRLDFTISGDTMKFDTLKRSGTFSGNVKMVITGQAAASPEPQ